MQQRVRFLTKVAAGFLSVWFLLFPLTANALGLGNIKMDSALNEPFKAEIELLSATSSDVKNLEVNLASREAFLRAGVDRSAILSRLKFNIVKHGSKYVVVLTTQQPVREPFLNFLVELNWKNGRMLREYTVLLDPADQVEQQKAAQAPVATPPESAPVPTPAVPTAESESAPEPTSPFLAEPETPQPAPAPAEAAKPEPAPAPAAAAAPEPAPAPEPMAAPEPAPAPEPMAAPEPAPEPMAEAPTPAEMPAPEQPFESQGEDTGLFPGIPLTAYKESKESESAPMPEPATGEASAPMPAGELDYGITKKGDTLWRIAEKLKPSDQVSIYQVMMALQQSNPKAFIQGNIHRLKVGQVMRIDDPSLLTAMSKAEAQQQYEQETTAWQDYIARNGGNVPRQTIVAGEQESTPAESGVTSGELTLATPQSDKNSAGEGGNAEPGVSASDAALVEEQARKALENAKKQKKQTAAYMNKLDELDAELKRMENLVTIKDSDLASLQRKLDELNAEQAAATTEKEAAETAKAPETTATPEPEAKPEPSMPAEPVTPPPMASAPAEEANSPEEQPAAPAGESTPETASTPEQPAQPAAPATPPVAAPKPAPMPAAPPSKSGGSGGIMGMITGFFSGVMGGLNAMMLIIGGVVVLVLILIVFIMMRRRKGASFQESILTGEGDTDMASMDSSPSQGSSLMGGESSFLSDFAISGVSAIQAEDSEVDPLTEADVFMAYGRYEAAEERLQEAITQDPNRGELRVKLLELFNTTKNAQAFESAAEDFYAALGGNVSGNPLWQKVLSMGRGLAPSNPLFSGGVAGSAPSAAASTPDLGGNQDVMDIGLDTGAFNTSDFSTEPFNEPASGTSDTGAGSDLDFNLDTGGAELSSADDHGLDFSLDDNTSGAAASEASDSDGLDFNLGNDDDLGDGLDFNLDSSTSSEEEPTAETESPAADASMDNLDFSLDMGGDDEPTATEIKLDMDDNLSGSDLDLDFAQELDSTSAPDMDLDASDASMSIDMSGGGDEVGTKLDLARAYIDMGDPDGARSILDEVMEEGNAGQKQEAEQLMAQIG